MSILRFLYQTLFAFLQIKDRKHIEQNFHSVAGVMPQGWDLGVLGGVKNFSVGICDGAPSTADSSLVLFSEKTSLPHHILCLKVPFGLNLTYLATL